MIEIIKDLGLVLGGAAVGMGVYHLYMLKTKTLTKTNIKLK